MKLNSLIQKVWPPFMTKEDRYYYHLFVKNKKWNSRTPNTDERLRWQAIEGFIRTIGASGSAKLSILDVGSGRGWMTNLLSQLGEAEGLDPVEAVVKYARKLFPSITFHHSTLEGFQAKEKRYDIIASSEVLEHVPDDHKKQFVRSLHALLRESGNVIVSTPRKEILAEIPTEPGQPVEDWLSEGEVEELFTQNGFRVVGRKVINMVYFGVARDVYQVWCFQAEKQNAG